ncbi:MAG: transglycosylase domain-containing protein [Acidimicrobiia bacterium]|nr:transglycosylase domain-containing protein [Acidimicrobiia bacterium]
MRLLLRFLAAIVAGGVVLASGAVAFAPAARDVVTAASSDSEEIELDGLAERSLVFAGDGTVMATLHAEENRSPVGLDAVPDEVVDTILAIEDREFYEHGGVNLRATARALLENVSAGDIEQGGSTITMQLAKNVLLTPEQDIDRKAKEIVLAWQIEDQYSKDEILERYLNTVYFGGGAYGVQAAAEIYWQQNQVGGLGWAEAALLAALIRNPVGYDPINFPERAEERRQIVLDELARQGLITEAEAEEYGNEPLPTERKPVLPPPEDYFVEQVKSQLLRDPRLGDTYQERENAVFRGGLRIYTTLNPTAEEMAERAVTDVMPPDADPVDAAMIAVEPSTGAVRAMVGGPGFDDYQYNLTTHEPGRQTGSAFKGVVLATLLEHGYVPADRVRGGGNFPCPDCPEEDQPYNVDGPGGTLSSVTAASSNGAFGPGSARSSGSTTSPTSHGGSASPPTSCRTCLPCPSACSTSVPSRWPRRSPPMPTAVSGTRRTSSRRSRTRTAPCCGSTNPRASGRSPSSRRASPPRSSRAWSPGGPGPVPASRDRSRRARPARPSATSTHRFRRVHALSLDRGVAGQPRQRPVRDVERGRDHRSRVGPIPRRSSATSSRTPTTPSSRGSGSSTRPAETRPGRSIRMDAPSLGDFFREIDRSGGGSTGGGGDDDADETDEEPEPEPESGRPPTPRHRTPRHRTPRHPDTAPPRPQVVVSR